MPPRNSSRGMNRGMNGSPFGSPGPSGPNFGGPRSFNGGRASKRAARSANNASSSARGAKASGGLLSKLFSRGNNAGTSATAAKVAGSGFQRGAATSASGSILKSVANPTNIQSFLTNTQQVIRTAQTVTPMIQQYGPIMKNLPAMWKLYRGLSTETETTEATVDAAVVTEAVAETTPTEDISLQNHEEPKEEEKKPRRKPTKTDRSEKTATGPKLYI